VRKCRELDLLPVVIPPRNLGMCPYVLVRVGQPDATSLLRQALWVGVIAAHIVEVWHDTSTDIHVRVPYELFQEDPVPIRVDARMRPVTS
jgi:hypothetical protein